MLHGMANYLNKVLADSGSFVSLFYPCPQKLFPSWLQDGCSSSRHPIQIYEGKGQISLCLCVCLCACAHPLMHTCECVHLSVRKTFPGRPLPNFSLFLSWSHISMPRIVINQRKYDMTMSMIKKKSSLWAADRVNFLMKPKFEQRKMGT